MRAVLEPNPQAGAGYGILVIYGAGEVGVASPSLRRVQDGMVLTTGGWRSPPGELACEDQDWSGNTLRLFLSPSLIDEIAPGLEYQVEIPGIGICPLEISDILQSTIYTPNGADLDPPSPAPTTIPPLDGERNDRENIIFEGVEPGPIDPHSDVSVNVPSGVTAIPDVPVQKRKRGGCLFLALFGIGVWLAGAWLLWHGSMAGAEDQNLQATEEKTEEQDSAPFFEIIPSSRESSFIEDEGDKQDLNKSH